MFTVYHRFLCACLCVRTHCMVISDHDMGQSLQSYVYHAHTACVLGDVLMWPPYIIIYNVTN